MAIRIAISVVFCAVLIFTVPTTWAADVPVGQVDDFQSGSMTNWTGGAILSLADGGPAGPGDRYLRVASDPNDANHLGVQAKEAWAGNYVANRILAITMDVRNLGTEAINLRMLTTGAGCRWASIEPVILPVGGGWQRVIFGLSAVDMVRVEYTGTLAANLSNINRIVFHHDPGDATGHGGSPELNGGVMGIDNVTAAGPTLEGDADLDNDVDLDDFLLLKQNFGASPASWMMGDFDLNNSVSLTDFSRLKNNFGTNVVPEPASLSLLAISALAMLRRRR